jgi:acyl-CoA thioester hydrolase
MESQMSEIKWDFPNPYQLSLKVAESDTDVLGHTNNVTYLRWLEQVAWAHSKALGLDWPEYHRLKRAMVVRRHELDYLAPSFPGDELVAGTWLTGNDGKLSLWRRYQLVRARDGATLLRGRTLFVCADLDSGKPRRMPQEFIQGYPVSPALDPGT